MSNPPSSQVPPPLPPPTVPSQNPISHPPPSQPNHPSSAPSPSLSTLLDKSPPSQTSSSDPNLPLMDDQTELHQHSHHDFPKKPPPPSCASHFRPSLTPHHIHEPATSLWFDTRILLVFRLAATAILLGHLVFFSLRGDFSYRLYSTWNYVGLTLTFILIVISSLLHILRDEDSYNDDPDIGTTQGEGMVTDIERQPVGHSSPPDPKLARALTRITLPLYQIFLTATLFGTIIYWVLIHDYSVTSFSYPLIILKVFAPAAALLDFLVSLRMRFRLFYLLLYTLYNGLYVGALVLFDKLQGDPVYPIFDPSAQTKEQFIAKTAGIAGASLVAGLLTYAFSYIPVIPCFTNNKKRPKKKPHSDNDSDTSPTTASDITSDTSPSKPLEIIDRDTKNTDSSDLASTSRKDLSSTRSFRSLKKKDRLSLPLTESGTMQRTSSSQWFRSSSARMVASNSRSSIGSDRQDSLSRTDSEKRSTWDSLNQPSARIEDEYFAMPTASGQREVIKLNPLPRNQSASSLPGLLSRSSSGRMSRSASRRMSGSAFSTRMVRSQSDRSAAVRSFSRSGSEPVLR